MTNNLNTIEGAQQEVIDQLEYNLQAKGVLDAQFNPTTGLLGLINRIPDIEPSTNINLNITLTLTSAEPSVGYGGSILLSATLMASYEGASDVDLKTGEITGATITFKKGGTIIGTSITDNNGVATLLYTPVAADCDTTLNLSAVFSGTDNFNSANSNNINVDVNSTLELTSDKDILSYADNEYATLTATLNSADKNNKEIIFEVRKQSDDSLVETLTGNTDSSGNATVYYYGKHTNLIYIQAISSNIQSTPINIEDCWKFDSGAIDKSSTWIKSNNNTSISHDSTNNCYILNRTSNGDTIIEMTDSIIPTGVKISMDIKFTGVTTKNHQPRFGLMNGVQATAIRFANYSSEKFIGLITSVDVTDSSKWVVGTATNLSVTSNTWYSLEIIFDNGTITATTYNGSTELGTVTSSYTNLSSTSNKLLLDPAYSNGANINIKNIKVKSL